MKQTTKTFSVSKLCKSALLSATMLAFGSVTAYAEDCMKFADLTSMHKCQQNTLNNALETKANVKSTNYVKYDPAEIEQLKSDLQRMENRLHELLQHLKENPNDVMIQLEYKQLAEECHLKSIRLELMQISATDPRTVTDLAMQKHALENKMRHLMHRLQLEPTDQVLLAEYQALATTYAWKAHLLMFIQTPPSKTVLETRIQGLASKISELKKRLQNDPTDPILQAELAVFNNDYFWNVELLQFIGGFTNESHAQSGLQHMESTIQHMMARFKSGNSIDKSVLVQYVELCSVYQSKSEVLMLIKWKNGSL